MRWWVVLQQRWRSFRGGAALDRDLDRELRDHLEDEVDELVARGVARDEARRRARLAFGPIVPVAEECREARGVTFAQNVTRDVRYGWRALARQPMLLAAASLSIALGVGANLAIYSIANDLLLSVPGARDAERLVRIRTGNGSHVSHAAWQAFESSHALDGVAGYQIERTVNLRDGAEATTIVPLLVTANFFDVVGVPVAMGRGFSADEAAAQRDPRLVVVGDAFWRQHMRAARDAVGSALILNGEAYTVMGVLPAGLRSVAGYGLAPDVYLPIRASLLPAMASPREPAVMLIGRLRDGQSLAQGRAAVGAVAAGASRELGDGELETITVFARVGGIAQVRDFEVVGAFFAVLLVVAGLVLVIACANVSGLLLARSATRGREIALRLALGASRRRLLQQLLTEGVIVAAVGTAIGIGLTGLLALAVSRISLPLPLPVRINPAFDPRLFVAALGLAGLSTILAALLPALQATRPALTPAIRQAPGSDGRRRVSLRRMLVVGQVAISMLLLIVTFTFLSNLARAASLDPGFEVDRVLVAQITFVEGRQGTAADPAVVTMVERVRSVPGVQAAAAAEGVPLTLYSGSWNGTELRVGAGADPVHAEFARNRVGPGYFDTMRIPLRGRDFTAADRAGADPVAIVNDAFVARYFGGAEAIGQAITEPRPDGAREYRVIGVAGTSKYRTLGEDDSPAVYGPLAQAPQVDRFVHVLARTAGPPAALIPSVRAAMLGADGSIAVDAQPMSAALAFAFLPSRIGAALLGALGLLGTMLAMVGLYGVVSFAVSRRVTEIGVRMALGATRRDVLALVLREAAWLSVGGVAVGLGLAYLATPPLGAFLVAGLSPSDPASFAGTALLLIAVCFAAAWTPAWRATRIDPTKALRAD
jgi:predicted permease